MIEGIGLVSEHESSESGSDSGGYDPTPEEKKALKIVDKFFQKAKKHRQQHDSKWLDYYKMFRGKQWKEQRPSYRHSEVINMVFQSIQSTVPIQTDARPRIGFMPTNPADTELAKMLDQACQSDWERYNWSSQLTEIVYDANLYGTGIGSMECNPEGEDGLPQAVFESDDPFYAFPDPNARDVNGKRTKGYLTAEPVDVSVLKAEYPDKAEFIKADLVDLIQGNKANLDNTRYKSPIDNNVAVEGSHTTDLANDSQAIKFTLYLYPDDIIEEEQDREGDDGEPVMNELGAPEKEYVQKLRYPKGRKIVTAGGVVLSDGPNPYEDGKIPKARLVNYMDPRNFWGISEVEQLESPQKIFNKLVSFALDVMTLMGNPIWVVDNEAGIDTDNLFNRPGLIVEKNKDSEVRRESGLDINPSVFQLIDRMKDWFNGVSGSQEVSQGMKPEGITAASAITSLQEAAQTRLRLKARHLDAFMQDLGQLWLSRAFQFYTSPRIFRLTENPESQKFFKMHFEEILDQMGQPVIGADGNPKRKAVVRDYQPTETGAIAPSIEAKEYEISGRFDVRVATGSSLPFAKAEKFGQAKMLFEAGVIDEEELLKTADWPNWEAVLARVQQKQQMLMAQQAQAAQAPPGAAPPAA